jgi:hypothetical protein
MAMWRLPFQLLPLKRWRVGNNREMRLERPVRRDNVGDYAHALMEQWMIVHESAVE